MLIGSPYIKTTTRYLSDSKQSLRGHFQKDTRLPPEDTAHNSYRFENAPLTTAFRRRVNGRRRRIEQDIATTETAYIRRKRRAKRG